MEDEESYQSLSRKELQELCKKKGLSARKTNSHMAKSLATYYQNIDLNMPTSEDRSSVAREALLNTPSVSDPKPQIQLDPIGKTHKGVHENRVEALDGNNCGPSVSSKEVPASAFNVMRKESPVNGTARGIGRSNNNAEGTTDCMLLGSECDGSVYKHIKKDSSKSILARDADHDVPGPAKISELGDTSNINLGALSSDGNFISSDGTTRVVAPIPFQFYVKSEEGINLCVDLNSNPSDWIKEVCIPPEGLSNKPWALHHGLRSLGNINAQPKASLLKNTAVDLQNESDTREGGPVGVNHQGGADRSLILSRGILSSTKAEMLGNVKGNSETILSTCNHNAEVQNPTNLSANSSLQKDESLNFGSAVCSISQTEPTGDRIKDSKLDGLKHTDALEHPSKCGSAYLENSRAVSLETSIVSHEEGLPLSSGTLEDSSPMVDIIGNGSATQPRSTACGGSTNVQASEVGNLCENGLHSRCHKGGRPDLNSTVHDFQSENGELANCKLGMNTHISPPSACPQKQQRSNLKKATAIAECLQNENSLKASKRLRSSEPGSRGHKRKDSHSEDRNKPVMKILRSGKNRARGASPRRSGRLVSK